MTLKLPPRIVQKVMALKALKHKDGKFFLWDVPSFIDPVYMQLYHYFLMEDAYGEETANAIRYSTGKLQAGIGVRIVTERFGYASTIPEIKKLEEFNHGQTALLGFGKLENVRMDFKNNTFIHRGVSAFGEEYRKIFGPHKKCVDYWLAGMYAGAFEIYTKKDLVCIETKCIVRGHKYCEFMTKPIEKWDKKSPIVKENAFLFKKHKKWQALGDKLKNKLGPFH